MPTEPQYITADEAVLLIKSRDRVFIHSVAAAPVILIEAMVARSQELSGVELIHLHTEGPTPYTDPKYRGIFHTTALFTGANMRAAHATGMADYLPIFLSEVPNLFRGGILPLDVAMLMVSPPDEHGYCSLGTSVDASLAAAESTKLIIAQVNPKMPQTRGDGYLHISKIDALVWHETPLYQMHVQPPTPTEVTIGRFIANLVEDGATLQMGIGSIPDAVLTQLTHHRHLGIHTEMFSDGVVNLYATGAIDNSLKRIDRGKIVAGFIMGTDLTYNFVNRNPMVRMRDIAYVNDTSIIRQNPKVTAINSCIEVDLTGQIVSDSIGTRIYSGVGGQLDFLRGAALSEGGKPIIALPSTTSKGESRIVPYIKEGAGVVTTRAHAHYVVTEFGVAYLYGKTLRQRAHALAAIAHPQHREALEVAIHARFVEP
jgi:acyl-CoA hydrolase